MILIKITKENREPEVGEWTAIGWKAEDDWDIELNPGLKALSLSVILDAPEKWDNPYWKIYDEPTLAQHPISNSEEIFQWLHDQGKLGEEWVEWEGTYNMYKDGSVMLLPNKINEKSLKEDFLNRVSKISETGEDEFKAEYNSPELIWENIIKHMLGNGR